MAEQRHRVHRTPKAGVARWFMLAAVVLFAACAPEPVPQDNFYRLSVPQADPADRPALDGILEVERFGADGLSGGRPIVYSRADTPSRLNEYHYHLWVEPPSVMVQDRFVAFARNAGLAATVVTPDMRVEPEYILTGRILRFEQVLGDAPQAVVGLEIGVRAVADGRIVLLRAYERGVPAADASVPAAVRSFDAALADIMQAFAADLRSL